MRKTHAETGCVNAPLWMILQCDFICQSWLLSLSPVNYQSFRTPSISINIISIKTNFYWCYANIVKTL